MGNSSKRDVRSMQYAERQLKAFDLRKAGASYEQISKQLKYGGATHAREDILKGIRDRLPVETVKEQVTLELATLDAMQLGIYTKATHGDPQAIDRVIRIQERRSAYLGLDMPKRIEQTNIEPSATPHEELLSRLAGIAAAVSTGSVPPGPDGEG